MSSLEKKLILAVILIGIVIIGGLLLWKNSSNKPNENTNVVQNDGAELEEYVQELEDGSKLNVSDKLRTTKTFEGLEIANIQLKEQGGITTLLADVTNKSGATTQEKKIKIEVLDKNGTVLTELRARIESIPVGGTIQLNMSTTGDVANAYDFRISNL